MDKFLFTQLFIYFESFLKLNYISTHFAVEDINTIIYNAELSQPVNGHNTCKF